jgi:Tubulin like
VALGLREKMPYSQKRNERLAMARNSYQGAMSFRPSVVLGVGGTGYKTLLHLKKRLCETFGEIPECFSLLAFDTGDPGDPWVDAVDGRKIRLDQRTEVEILQVEDPPSVIDESNPHISNWWPFGTSISAITAGATQVRPRGRLAFFAQYAKILQRLKEEIISVKNVETPRKMGNLNLVNTPGIDVYVISSLAGGTGSGMFLDLSFTVRSLILPSSRITGMLVMPRIFGDARNESLYANSYGALKELEHFMGFRDNDVEVIDYGLQMVEVRKAPFDLVYLVDGINERRSFVTNMDALYGQVADGLFNLIASPMGQQVTNLLENVRGRLFSSKPIRERLPIYFSFGLACFRRPETRIANWEEAQIAKLGASVVSNILKASSQDQVSLEVARLLVAIGIERVDEKGESLMNKLQSPGGAELLGKMSVDNLPYGRKLALKGSLVRARDAYDTGIVQAVDHDVALRLAALRHEFRREFDSWWDVSVNNLGAVGRAIQVIDAMREGSNKFVPIWKRRASALTNNIKTLTPVPPSRGQTQKSMI